MPTKAEFYRQMAEQVSTRLVGSWKEWTAFLTTAARLYKYPFHEQMMIYAQRPDATACAEYDLWNEKMGRYVRRGSKAVSYTHLDVYKRQGVESAHKSEEAAETGVRLAREGYRSHKLKQMCIRDRANGPACF